MISDAAGRGGFNHISIACNGHAHLEEHARVRPALVHGPSSALICHSQRSLRTVRTNAKQQSCADPGAWLSDEVWDAISHPWASWPTIRQAVVKRLLQIGLVRPGETTLQALVAVIWLSRNRLSDDLDVEETRSGKQGGIFHSGSSAKTSLQNCSSFASPLAELVLCARPCCCVKKASGAKVIVSWPDCPWTR